MAERYRRITESNAARHVAENASRLRHARKQFVNQLLSKESDRRTSGSQEHVMDQSSKNSLTQEGFVDHGLPIRTDVGHLEELQPEVPAIIAHAIEAGRTGLDEGAFLAGFFEARGHMNMYVKTTRVPRVGGGADSKTYVSPNLKYTDTDRVKLNSLMLRFGGHIKIDNDNSSTWNLNGHKAVEVAHKMRPFTQVRTGMADAFSNWANATLEERIEIARDMHAANQVQAQPQDYSNAIDNPSFLAGVFESAGKFEPRMGHNSKAIMLSTTNRALLEAINERYGGTFRGHEPKQYVTLRLGSGVSGDFLQTVSPCLLSK